MSSLKLGSRVLNYDVLGQGRNVVFVHSLGTDMHLWDAVVERLPGIRAVRYDLPGHGESSVHPGTVESHAADLSKLLELVAPDGAVVVGASVGGMIAQRLAVRNPEQVHSLALSSTGLRIGGAAYWASRIEAVERQGMEALATSIVERWFSSTWREDHPMDLERFRKRVAQLDPSGHIDLCRALADADLTSDAHLISTRCLCLGGTSDPSTPPEVLSTLARAIPEAQLCFVDGAGHLPMIEAPDLFCRHLQDVL